MSDALAERPGLSAQEKRALAARLLREKAARQAAGANASAHRMIEAQAARTPEAEALRFAGERLSYAELNARANRLAHYLRGLGGGPEVLVGLFIERSPEMVVALLGVLKAGGAYVPLDPAYPADRVGYMIEDSRAPLILTQAALLDRLPAHDSRAVCLDSDWDSIAAHPDTNPGIGDASESLAYVIYTSGSTGRPKGVMIPHGALGNFLRAMRETLSTTGRDSLLAVTTLSFDIAALELLLPLCCGGRIALANRATAADGARLAGLLESESATVLQATPATWRMLLESGWEGRPGLTMLCGGEALPRELADRLQGKGERLWNLYGPTEATVWATATSVEPGDGPITIGRPIAGLQAYVLDARLRPTPIGVVGELYLGGAGLARGYLGRPGLTADRFLPDPYGAPGSRMYRTGDLARRLPGGPLECLGRSDHQVKVRGHRVELGEVEAALDRHPGVRRAAVTARPDSSGEARLIAYVVPEPGAAVAPEDLRVFLRGMLPEYMVPSVFAELASLPLTPNGKVDRNALPEPESAGVETERAHVPPRTPAEEVVANIWATVLGLDRVGAFDDFFELGGHSLLATRVVSRLRDAFSVEVPLSALFEAPTVAGLAARVEEARRGGRERAVPPITPAPREGPLPPSFTQQALWFLDQLAPGRPTFNVSAAVRIDGPLDLDALTRSYAEILRRHEALRTTFGVDDDGRPVQVITPVGEGSLPLEVADLRDLREDERDAEARRLAGESLRHVFDLARGPLIHARLILLGEAEGVVVLTMHHIITDGWSFGVATRELSELYLAFRDGQPSPLPDLPIQYADYAVWQRDRLQGEVLDEQVDYWHKRLADPPQLELPADRPRPATRTDRGGTRGFSLPADLSRDLQRLSRREGATLFMTLLSGFQVLLHRYSGQDDIVIGSPVANRTRSEVEGLIGYFVNMLALRTDLSGRPSFREVLRRVREAALGAYEHQELPLEKVVEAVQPSRDPSRTPLFDAMFVLQNNAPIVLNGGGLVLSGFDAGGAEGTAKFHLTLALSETPEGLAGSIEYNTDLFDAARIDRMAVHLGTLLASAVADPSRPISELELMTEPERSRILTDGIGPGADAPADGLVHQLIEGRAGRTPEAVAVVAGAGSLTYRELDGRANRLAHRLREMGVGPDAIVGVGLDRSPELAIGLLAVLKAGGAFLPLDPDYPRDRLAWMLEDSATPVVLSRGRLLDRWPSGGFAVIDLDLDEASTGDASGPPSGGASPDDAAYVIYTSGSTGRPRGVVVPHRAMANHHAEAVRLYGLGPGERVLQFSALGFDGSIEEMFPAWTAGATVVFREPEILDPIGFTRWVAREGITVLDLPTAYWHEWADGLGRGDETIPDSLRLVVVGGEKASASALAHWQTLAGERVRWMNTYGPTEATIIASWHEATGPVSGEVPIGRPIANTRLYVLDDHLRLCTVGAPGELYIGGSGLARGYLRSPGLTAERFLPDPFGEPGARMYRTGDRARWLEGGVLEYLGRCDEQVKVRGHRVEPGEVEAALRKHPEVREAAVVAREVAPGELRLVAYVVARPGGPSPSGLLRFLKQHLPRPMLPSSVVLLDSLPLTPGGKVDRNALPAPDTAQLGAAVPPRDEVETRLAAIWEDLLGVRPVGVSDNFFDLGGHSMTAARLMARVEEAFGRRLPLATLFVGETIEALAEVLREGAHPAPSSPLVEIRGGRTDRSLFLVHPVGGNVLCYRELAQRQDPGLRVFGFQAAGLDGDHEPDSTIEAMATRYLGAMREAQPEGPYLLGGWSLGGVVAFEMARQLREEGDDLVALVVIDSLPPAPGGGTMSPDEAALLAAFAADLVRGMAPHGDRPDPAGASEGFEALARIAPGLDAEQLHLLYRTYRANLLARAHYEIRPAPGSLVLIRAEDGTTAGAADPTLGWGSLALGGVEVHAVPGDHYSILKAPGVELTARRLAEALAGAGARRA